MDMHATLRRWFAAVALLASAAAVAAPPDRVRIPSNDRWIPAAVTRVALADGTAASARSPHRRFRFRPRGPQPLDPSRQQDPTQVGRPTLDDARDAYVQRGCLFDPLQSKCR